MEYKIALMPGDGIGPEIIKEARKVLDATAKVYGHTFSYEELLLGGASIDAYGEPLTEETIAKAKSADAVLMGAVGADAKTSPWYRLSPEKRPEAGLLKLRKELKLFANLRPAYLYEALKDACPVKEQFYQTGIDLMIVRELTGGLYFGERKTVVENGIAKAVDTLTYDEKEIRRIAKKAFETAVKRKKKVTSVDKANVLDSSRLWRKITEELTYDEKEIRRIAKKAFETAVKRKKKVTSVDKANVLDSSRLWRKITEEVAADYPEVTLEHMLVDNCAMQLICNPEQFDVILTENMFGDILSDEASMLTGSIGMLPSASLNETSFGLYEPSHGSAPDIAGKGIANPIAAILSAAMLLRYSFSMEEEAKAIENAVNAVLNEGYRTSDIMSENMKKVSTGEMGDLIIEKIQ